MNTDTTTSRQIIRGAVVAAAVVAANLIAAEPGDVEAMDSTAAQRIVPEAPAPIVGIAAPDIQVSYSSEGEIVVPAIRRVENLPELPMIDVETVRETAATWLGNGIMAAPEREIEVASPSIDGSASGIEPAIQVPALERPALPEPSAIR